MLSSRIKLDLTLRKPLTVQLAEVLRRKIVRCEWKTGDVLPGIHELAAMCGTSERVPRAALAQLAAEGWVCPRRGVGSVVADHFGSLLEEGRVLIYVHRGRSYYFANMTAAIESAVKSAGYGVTVVRGDEKAEGKVVDRFAELLRERWSMVLFIGSNSPVRRLLSDSGLPYILVGDGSPMPCRDSAGCVGCVEIRADRALPDFVRTCMARCVKRVVQFIYAGGAFDATALLERAGVSVKTVNVPHRGNLEEIVSGGMKAMQRVLSAHGGKCTLPDLFFFTDDYLARGALLAMAAAGVRSPGDVFVATLANKGLGPVWTSPLSRLEVNSVALGRSVAKAVVGFLKSGSLPQNICLGTTWVRGETF